MRFTPVHVPEIMKKVFEQEVSKWVKSYRTDCDLRILVSMDKTHHGMLRHMSISREDRYPSWDEIVEAKGVFFGDVDTMMIMPKMKDYINVSNNCFHVWETPVEWNVR